MPLGYVSPFVAVIVVVATIAMGPTRTGRPHSEPSPPRRLSFPPATYGCRRRRVASPISPSHGVAGRLPWPSPAASVSAGCSVPTARDSRKRRSTGCGRCSSSASSVVPARSSSPRTLNSPQRRQPKGPTSVATTTPTARSARGTGSSPTSGGSARPPAASLPTRSSRRSAPPIPSGRTTSTGAIWPTTRKPSPTTRAAPSPGQARREERRPLGQPGQTSRVTGAIACAATLVRRRGRSARVGHPLQHR